MVLAPYLFYLFAAVLVGSAVMVVAARNPVHAVLFLVLCFFNAAGLFLLQGAEFIAFILIIVYVGAVAVLFLFVVMMLDVEARAKKFELKKRLPAGLAVGLILLAQLALVVGSWRLAPPPAAQGTNLDNTRAIGRLLYTDYMVPFQIAGLILLVSMVSAIVLTLRVRKTAKRQNVADQLARRPEDAMEIRKVKTGEGVP